MLIIVLGIIYVLGIFLLPFVIGLVSPDNNFDLNGGPDGLLLFIWPIFLPILLLIEIFMNISLIFHKIKTYGEYLGQKRIDRKLARTRLQEDLNQRDFYDNVN